MRQTDSAPLRPATGRTASVDRSPAVDGMGGGAEGRLAQSLWKLQLLCVCVCACGGVGACACVGGG